jgi:hypothetical protein
MRATRLLGAAVVLAGAGWAAGRIARGPARVDIRAFDPDEVARLERAMWRSYYDRRRLPLYAQLVALLRGQFQLSPGRSLALAFLAARAAAVFQVGRDRADDQRALPYLERSYAAILGGHAERRAEAMTIRDRRSREPGGVTEADWRRIEDVLRQSWRSLAAELHAGDPVR